MRIDTFKGKEKRILFWEDGDDSTTARDYMLKHNLTGIVFSKYLGFQEERAPFFEPNEFVNEIHIIDSNMKDVSFVMAFPNIKTINIQNDDQTKLDFDIFNNVEDVFLIWRKGVTNLFNKKCLKSLKIERFKEKKLPEFENDMCLEELRFASSPIENLSSLNRLKNLKILQLDYLRCLEDSSWLKELGGLEILSIGSCKKLSNAIMHNASKLTNLKKLSFSKMGEIPTLQPIQNLKKLETIVLVEDTKILDGNLHVLLDLPLLNNINVQGFKHYAPSISSIMDIKKNYHQ